MTTRRGAAPRRQTQWLREINAGTLTSGTDLAHRIDSPLNAPHKGVTVIRILMSLNISGDGANTDCWGGMGIAIINDAVLTASAEPDVSSPDPYDYLGLDLWRIQVGGTLDRATNNQWYRYDLHSQRKYQNIDENLWLLMAASVGPVTYRAITQVLVKLP